MKNTTTENIYISWHYTTHGMAYLKHILSAFYSGKVNIENISSKNISQEEMDIVFDKQKKGFLFDKVYYLTSEQESFDKLSTRRFTYKSEILKDPDLLKNNTIDIWKEIIELKKDNLESEIAYIKDKYSVNEFEKWHRQIWRNIHQYTIDDQIKWFKQHSNAHPNYKNDFFFREVNLKVDNLRDQLEIAKKLKVFIDKIKKLHPNANFIINASLGSNETQVVWQVFSELNYLPQNIHLIRCYDNKRSVKNERFKLFDIEPISTKIVSEIEANLKLFERQPISEVKKLAELKMAHYLVSGFPILLIGERGIGKSHLAESQISNKKFISVNCASFADDTMAESELFGYLKNSFTGANNDKDGLFWEAKDGILFLDEIHHLSTKVQAKLMKAIQTDSENFLSIRRLGENTERKLKTTLIFASNKEIHELRKTLLPDFYDRISQQIIELPSLRETPEEITNDFKNTWIHMKFEAFYSYEEYIEKDKNLLEWLKTLELYGNYRDLQKITISYKNFLDFNKEIRKLLKEKTAFEFTKNEYKKYINFHVNENNFTNFFSEKKTVQQMEKEFKKELAIWAINRFKGAPNAVKHFNKLGGKTTKETLYRWINNQKK